MNMFGITHVLLPVVAILFFCSEQLRADNWSNWRGPQQNGTAPEADFPLQWGPEENIAWRVELAGSGASTPIVWQDRIILTTPIEGKNGVICLDRTGQKLWQATVGEEVPGKHRKGTGTNPSPVTDGETIFVYFKSGDFAALDFSGMVLWQQNLQEEYAEDTLWWDLGTSPVLTSRHVVVACMQTGPSYLAAFDKSSGEEAWKVDRNLGAPEEAAQSYSTPVVVTHEGQEQIIVLGADHVTCHDAADGREIWRVGGFNPDGERFFRSIASPVITNGIVIAPYARGNTLTAIRMGGEGDVTESHVLWRKSGLSADVPTPVARDGKVYVCTDRGTVGCLDAETGEELWTVAMERNRNNYSSSPILSGQRLYLIREDGTAFVVNVAEQQVVSTNALKNDTFVVATPVFVGNEILIRTFEELYSIREGSASVSSE